VLSSGHLFGAHIDWINQHTAIPDYFRQYFYDTGRFLPDLSFHFGAGQNFFSFAYYGILSPIILLSYLFPFLSMTAYISIISILCIIFSIALLYRWLRPKFSMSLTTLLVFIFACAAPLIFHSHRHIMFVNYMPFLILALICIDNFTRAKYRNIFVIATTLLILTNFFFGFTSLIVLFIYYLHKNPSIRQLPRFIIPAGLAVLISAVLIIPSALAILASSTSRAGLPPLDELLLPSFTFQGSVYGAYNIGLSFIALLAPIWALSTRKKNLRLLSIILIIIILFPLARFLLNGGLYTRPRCLIPFIPLYILFIGEFLKALLAKKITTKFILISSASVLALCLIFNRHQPFMLDVAITAICLLIFIAKRYKVFIFLPLIIFYTNNLITTNLDEDYVPINSLTTIAQSEKTELFKSAHANDNSFYRVSDLASPFYTVNTYFGAPFYRASIYSSIESQDYINFNYRVLRTHNDIYNELIIQDKNHILRDRLMGVKYIISSHPLGPGYQLVKIEGDLMLYRNPHALSLGIATSNVYNIEQLTNIPYPYHLNYLMSGISVNGATFSPAPANHITHYESTYTIEYGPGITVGTYDHGATRIDVSEDSHITVYLDTPVSGKMLLIRLVDGWPNSCSIPDIGITINGIENTLTCWSWPYSNYNYTFHYLLNEDYIDRLDIAIRQGEYHINGIEAYLVDPAILEHSFDEMTNIVVDGSTITGDITVTSDGYMMLSIPYDKNFRIEVNGQLVEHEKVNTAFIGFPISAGNHHIKVTYTAPGKRAGITISILGLIAFTFYVFYQKQARTNTSRGKND
jgi:uncharacterized membrane protein YfhO